MSMGSYEGMPARSDPRRKPLEHLVSAFLQAVMRVQRKQQQVRRSTHPQCCSVAGRHHSLAASAMA